MQLMSQRLIELIEKSADEISRRWLEDVIAQPELVSYRAYDKDSLFRSCHALVSHLGEWVSRSTSKEEIEKRYSSLGAQRYREGFQLSELAQALILTRRRIWLKVLDAGLLDNILDMHTALELNNRVILFFDRALFAAARGYEKGRQESEGVRSAV